MSKFKLSFFDELMVCEKYKNNISIKEIAKELKISTSTVENILTRNKIQKRKTRVFPKENLIPINENYFSNIDTKNKAYYLGIIIGDGHLSVTYKRFLLALKIKYDDTSILEKLIWDSKSQHKIRHRITYLKTTNKEYDLSSISIYRPKICQDLIKLGITPLKSSILKFPKVDKSFVRHVIRGIIDSDGSFNVGNTNKIKFNIQSSVKSFLFELGEILVQNCNLKSINIYPGHGNCWALQYGGASDIENIANYVYSDGGFWLPRKYNVCENFYETNNFKYLSDSNILFENHMTKEFINEFLNNLAK